MLSARTLVAALALAVAIVMAPASAFAPANGNSRPTTSLAVMGPKQAATMERLKNPAKFESTIQVCVFIGLCVCVYIEQALQGLVFSRCLASLFLYFVLSRASWLRRG